MHPIGKMIAGLILILVGLALFAMPSLQVVDWLGNFIILLTGTIPILLIIIGLFVIWLEADELKVSKEFETEEKSEKEEVKKKVAAKPKTVAKKTRKKRARRKKAAKKSVKKGKPVEEPKPVEEEKIAVDQM